MEGKEQLEEAVMEDTPLVYPTSVTVPTDLPTETRTVDETSLPFYLTQREDGKWEKVDNAWRLYGREAGVSCVGELEKRCGNRVLMCCRYGKMGC